MKHLIACAMLVAAALAPAAEAGTTNATIATVTHGSVRAVVIAHRTSSGPSPSASVTVTAYRSTGAHRWVRGRRTSLGGGYFWKTVTAPHDICRLRLRGTTLTISLLVTPSIGCGRTRTARLA
jgi:hypothetical protein